jgi:uncharacterized protein (UPF0335 family)
MTRPKNTTPVGPGHNSIDKAKLNDIIGRIEAIEAERTELASDVKDLLAEAKAQGFDVRAIRTIVRLRRQDQEKRTALQATIDEYMAALGGLADLPLGKAAMERAGLMPPV